MTRFFRWLFGRCPNCGGRPVRINPYVLDEAFPDYWVYDRADECPCCRRMVIHARRIL